MKVKFEDGRIYLVIREYSNFHMKAIDVENRITTGEAIRLRSELDAVISASQQGDSSDSEIARRDFEREIYKQCDKEDATKTINRGPRLTFTLGGFMNLEKWKTSVVGVGPWIVSDKDDPLGKAIGVFREEKHADIFISALIASQPVIEADAKKPAGCTCITSPFTASFMCPVCVKDLTA